MVEIAAGQQVRLSANVNIEETFGESENFEQIKEAASDGVITEEEYTELKGSFSSTELDELLKDGTVEAKGTKAPEETGKTDGTDGADGTGETKDPAALKNEIDALEKEINDAKTNKGTAEKTLGEKEDELAQEQKKYDDTLAELKEENEEFRELSDRIDNASKDLEDDTKRSMKEATFKAIAEYDPEKDGEWEEYLGTMLEGVDIDPAQKSFIKKLGLKTENLSEDIRSLSTKLADISKNISSIKTEIQGLNDTIAACDVSIAKEPQLTAKKEEYNKLTTPKEADGTQQKTGIGAYQDGSKLTEEDKAYLKSICGDIQEGNRLSTFEDPGPDLTHDEILNLVSDEERALIDEMGVNIYEKLEDGSPRYIFAQGDCDGKYHIYDMKEWNGMGDNSLARKKYTYDGPSFNIVPPGNGGIMQGTFQMKSDDECSGSECPGLDNRRIYYLDSCDSPKSARASYETWSPLTFDLEGDGNTTTDEKVKFDIDGDGTVDTINNTNDAILVFDADNDGVSGEDGSELFGDNTDLDGDGKADGYKDGFEALGALARKEGLINDGDDMKLDADDLALLSEKYGLKMRVGGFDGTDKSFDEVGITEINISNSDKVLEKDFDGKGNDKMTQSGASFVVNGEERNYDDLWYRKYDEDGAQENVSSDSNKTSNKGEAIYTASQMDSTQSDLETAFLQNEANFKDTMDNAVSVMYGADGFIENAMNEAEAPVISEAEEKAEEKDKEEIEEK